MERYSMSTLTKWKESDRKNPLVVFGERRVGKTWILEEFGKSYPDGFVRINFEKQPEFHQFFQTTKDVKRIIQNLSFAVGRPITSNTLVILDEIQECEEAVGSLKYFHEDAPEYNVVSAVSRLGQKLVKGFPVDKVDYMRMGPMSFEEFLEANGDQELVGYLKSIDTVSRIPEKFSGPLTEKLKMYFVVGGMPEAVKAWTEGRDIREVDRIQGEILDAYESDYAKHADSVDMPKIRMIWNSLPSQLARENKKFQYSVVKKSARAREYENALNWLVNAGLVKKVPRITKPGYPPETNEDPDAFKIYMGDVGLLRRHSRLSSSIFSEGNRLFEEFEGALAENFVLESLLNIPDLSLHYWSETPYDVDFIIRLGHDVFPVEVKTGRTVKAASIKNYANEYKEQTKLCIRLSMRNLSYDGKVLNVPLYLADELERIVALIFSKTTNSNDKHEQRKGK